MAEEKQVTDFHEGDRVEFRCLGYVRKVTPVSVHVSLDDLNEDIQVPPHMLKNRSDAHEVTLEEAMGLDVDDELVKAVERVLGDLFWHAGKIAEPPPSTKKWLWLPLMPSTVFTRSITRARPQVRSQVGVPKRLEMWDDRHLHRRTNRAGIYSRRSSSSFRGSS